MLALPLENSIAPVPRGDPLSLLVSLVKSLTGFGSGPPPAVQRHRGHTFNGTA